jgi:hypothetical protein
MVTKERVLLINKYSNQVLELIEKQMRNDEDSLTQSDLQGAVDAIVMNILTES